MDRGAIGNLLDGRRLLRDASASGNLKVMAALLGPAYRGLVARRGREETTRMPLAHDATFDWGYTSQFPELGRLYEVAKGAQWNAATDLDWTRPVDPLDPEHPLLPDSFLPVVHLPVWRRLTEREKNTQRHAMAGWLLSQFLHGEQAALFAASQVTQAVPWYEGKLFGGTQVVDEARHVEAFSTYLRQKLERLYRIDDNLFVVIDALMSGSDWDLKFLGMQILIEGLALGAFGTIRARTREPLLRDLLTYVIDDEARHVWYGVLALRRHYVEEHQATREREDWAFEIVLLLRNRFFAHEFYDEYYGGHMTRAQWDAMVLESDLMAAFRDTMLKRIIPNLRRIGLLSDRVQARYESIDALRYAGGKDATQLTRQELLEDAPGPAAPGAAAAAR
jgi:hypothetical protein